MSTSLKDRVAKAINLSKSSGWYFDKTGERLNATHKVEHVIELIDVVVGEIIGQDDPSSTNIMIAGEHANQRQRWQDIKESK